MNITPKHLKSGNILDVIFTLAWKNKEKQKERYEKTLAKIAFMESKDYTVHFIWEREFKNQLKENDDLKPFVRNRKPIFIESFHLNAQNPTF